ncbi:MAG: hypothetical protein Q9190_002877 [Brigantiaea leucoxantha]
MAASTVMYFLGRHIAVLIVARALQGVSAAIVWVSGLALLAASFSDDKAGAAIGMTSVGISAGELSGPIIGGLLYDQVGHFAVFAVAMSVVGLDVVLRLLMTQKSPAAVNDEQDRLIPDEEIPSFGTAGAQDDVSQNQCSEMNTRQSLVTKYTPKTNDTKVEANDTAKLTSIFWLLLRQPRFLASLWAEAVVAVFRTAFESVSSFEKVKTLADFYKTLVLLVSSHFQWNPTASGLAIFAFLAPNLLGPFVGSYTGRHGPRWLTALTFFGMTPLFIAIAFSTANTLAAKIIFIILLALLGSGQAVNMTSHMVAISMIVERSKREDPDIFGRIDVNGQAYALMNLAYAAGMLVGPVWADLFIERLSWRALCLSFATLSLVSGILVAFFSLHGEADNEENNS